MIFFILYHEGFWRRSQYSLSSHVYFPFHIPRCRQYLLRSHKYFVSYIRRGIGNATNISCAFKDFICFVFEYWQCRRYLWSFIRIRCFILVVWTIPLSVHTYYLVCISKDIGGAADGPYIGTNIVCLVNRNIGVATKLPCIC